MEYVDLYDESMRPLYKVVSREKMRKQDDFFFIVHVWIRNAKGQYLIQKRNKDEDFSPFMWATTMGVVQTKQTTSEAALQEVKEELGLTFTKDQLTLIARYKTKSTYANHFTDVFVIEEDVDLKDVKIQATELQEVKFVSKKTLYDMINKKQFWDYRDLLHISDYFTDLEKSE